MLEHILANFLEHSVPSDIKSLIDQLDLKPTSNTT